MQNTIIFQTARPILYDASTVNEMIADVDSIDIVSISSQALYTNTEDTEKSDLDADLNSECKYEVFLRYRLKIARECWIVKIARIKDGNDLSGKIEPKGVQNYNILISSQTSRENSCVHFQLLCSLKRIQGIT